MITTKLTPTPSPMPWSSIFRRRAYTVLRLLHNGLGHRLQVNSRQCPKEEGRPVWRQFSTFIFLHLYLHSMTTWRLQDPACFASSSDGIFYAPTMALIPALLRGLPQLQCSMTQVAPLVWRRVWTTTLLRRSTQQPLPSRPLPTSCRCRACLFLHYRPAELILRACQLEQCKEEPSGRDPFCQEVINHSSHEALLWRCMTKWDV